LCEVLAAAAAELLVMPLPVHAPALYALAIEPRTCVSGLPFVGV
jgi:hypothetical protein